MNKKPHPNWREKGDSLELNLANILVLTVTKYEQGYRATIRGAFDVPMGKMYFEIEDAMMEVEKIAERALDMAVKKLEQG